MSYFISALKKYAVFNGRARRKEFWMFSLISFGVPYVFLWVGIFGGMLVGTLIDPGFLDSDTFLVIAMSTLVIYLLAYLFFFIPTLAVTIRRLHDIGESGAWYFISFVPFGSILLFIFMLKNGQAGPNQYGPDPKMAEQNFM